LTGNLVLSIGLENGCFVIAFSQLRLLGHTEWFCFLVLKQALNLSGINWNINNRMETAIRISFRRF